MLYVGLDVSVARTAVCVMDAAGEVVREQSVASTPEAIATAIRASGEVERVGLEAGINSAWIARGLGEVKLPVTVIDSTHAAATLKTGFRNKTDKNDARGVADLMRVNKFRAVSVKSVAAQRARALLTVREQLRRQSLDARNTIWSILQVEGLKPPKLTSPAFQALLAQSLDDEALAPLLRPLVDVVEHIDSQVLGGSRGQASRPRQGQGRAGAQAGRRAAQNVDGGRGLSAEGRSLAVHIRSIQSDRPHQTRSQRSLRGRGWGECVTTLWRPAPALCRIRRRA
jgi:hypothetical protein